MPDKKSKIQITARERKEARAIRKRLEKIKSNPDKYQNKIPDLHDRLFRLENKVWGLS